MQGGGGHEQTAVLGLAMQVAGSRDGVASLKVVVERFDLQLPGAAAEHGPPHGEDVGERDLVRRAAEAVVGRSFELRMDDRGRVLEVTGFSAALAEALKGAGGEARASAHLEELLGDSELATLLQTAFPRLAEAPLAEGGTWSDAGTVRIHRLGELAAKHKAKVTAVEGKDVRFKTIATLEPRDGSVGSDHGELDLWSAAAEGTATWDSATGRLAESSSTTRVTADAHGRELRIVVSTRARRLADPPR